jgi:nucleoside-diphosphate-sugar epimerase
MKILVSGSSGFLAKVLLRDFEKRKIEYVGVDLADRPPGEYTGRFIKADLCETETVQRIFKETRFDAVIHLASKIDFASSSQADLYDNNLKSTENLCRASIDSGVGKFIFTSSNSVYLGNPETVGITEEIKPIPTDMYGRSKVDSEELLNSFRQKIRVLNLRCPNIIDAGRVGMLSILFELIESNSTLWTVGDGSIRHQCLFAGDLVDLFHHSLAYEKSDTFNLGSDRVPTFREMYQALIERAGSSSKIRPLPRTLSIYPLKILYALGLSPLGPYQFRMLTRDFIFDNHRVKRELAWQPSLNNTEMLSLAYDFFVKNKKALNAGEGSANSSPVNMGVLKLLKLF